MSKEISDNSDNLNTWTSNSYLSSEYLKNVAWQFRQALHSNDQETIEDLLNSASLTITKKKLLNAMQLSWQNNKKAKFSLESSLKGTDLIDKLWVSFTLSELYLSQGDIDSTKYYSDVIAKQVVNKQGFLPTYLSDLVSIWNINLKIFTDKLDELGYQQNTTHLKNIISSSDTKLTKGYAYLTLGILEKSFSSTPLTEYFQKAITELEGVDYYYLSLAQLELAKLAKLELIERKKLVLMAESNFRKLNKPSEIAKTQHLISELNFGSFSTNNKYESIGRCLFASRVMKNIKQNLEVFARYSIDDPILILGERGTGKERIALAIGELSKKEVYAFNCSLLSKDLFVSEMFGHKKGSFTGANEDKLGLFEKAGDGILFLDEVGEIPMECQAKFLRVLQERNFSRIGEETQLRTFNGRVVAATNKDLNEMVLKGSFRADLFDRLSVLVIDLPPLSKRREEIIPLAEFFLEVHGRGEGFILSQSAKDYLLEKEHEGNIRGLETEIRRVILKAFSCSIKVITKELFLQEVAMAPGAKENQAIEIEAFDITMGRYAKKVILQAIELSHGDKTLAMNGLRLSRGRWHRLLKDYDIK